MKSLQGFASPSSHARLAVFLFGALSLAACDQSNSVGKIADTSATGGGSTVERDGGFVPAGGATASAAGGISGGAGKGGGAASGQAGASGGGKAGASGSGAVDAGVDRYQCPPTNVYCPDGYTTDAYGCTVCATAGTGGSAAGGITAKGGAGGTRVDAGIDGHVCPPITDVYCTNYITDAYGCMVCAWTGTGGASGGTSGKGGSGGIIGSAGASGSGGRTAQTCQRRPEDDSICRSFNYPPLAYFCRVPALPPSSACKGYNGIDSGDFDCCPDQYITCPDSPPSHGTACTGSLACTYNSHPDPTCRTSATCANGTWQVKTPPSRCSAVLSPATCPATSTAGAACSPRDLGCAYADGQYCICSNCTVEDNLCNASTPDTWRCWSAPGGDCPTYYPNLGSACALPTTTTCRYTCADITTCSAAGVWVAGANRCPN